MSEIANITTLNKQSYDRPYEDTPVLPEQAPLKRSFEVAAQSAVGQQGALRNRLFYYFNLI
ncbi:MAG: hypothetical protein KME32_01655 [Mojavia pulchra JT2-VF2]|uniref:Uncharacterized protein n=1 Tax=Mojavia pulchra JT2-VF2 TaxID=287848 RepID=A0A951PU18_9NOST|nr:hypothetical protein [Mojavia pulchra JT2-VF2]